MYISHPILTPTLIWVVNAAEFTRTGLYHFLNDLLDPLECDQSLLSDVIKYLADDLGIIDQVDDENFVTVCIDSVSLNRLSTTDRYRH